MAIEENARWEIIMPLGCPVDPEVNTTYTQSSGVTAVPVVGPSRTQDWRLFHAVGSPSTVMMVTGASEVAWVAMLLELSITAGSTIWQISRRRCVGCPESNNKKALPAFITARTATDVHLDGSKYIGTMAFGGRARERSCPSSRDERRSNSSYDRSPSHAQIAGAFGDLATVFRMSSWTQ